MRVYGIYDTKIKRVVCSPIADYAHLKAIIERRGLSTESLIFDGVQKIGHFLILPGIDIHLRPPKEIGYTGEVTEWEIIGDELQRSITWQPSEFEDFISQLKAEISDQQEQSLSLLEIGYTLREVKSWPQQRAEATEYTLDNAKNIPLLKGMAERRGIPLATFVQHVQTKVKVTADLTAIILGDAQAANDQIKALQALGEAEKLPNDWFDQLTNIADSWRKDWPDVLLTT